MNITLQKCKSVVQLMSNSYFAKKEFSMLSINKDTGGKMQMTLNEKNETKTHQK